MGRQPLFNDPKHALRRLYKRRDYARRVGKPVPALPGQSDVLARLRSMRITPEELSLCGVVLPKEAGR